MEYLNLIKAVIEASESNDWNNAKHEWYLTDVQLCDYSNGPEYCLCGHEIRELCFIKNKLNGNELMVGNVCVKKFLGIRSDKIFNALKKIKKDITASVNTETLQHAWERNWINQKAYDFYTQNIRKRSLTLRQQEWKSDINKRIIERMVSSRKRKQAT